MEQNVKLTKLASCAGCGAKVGAGMLAQLFDGFAAPRDPNLLVGFDHADDAAVYKLARRACHRADGGLLPAYGG